MPVHSKRPVSPVVVVQYFSPLFLTDKLTDRRCLTVPLWAVEVRYVLIMRLLYKKTKQKQKDENVQEEKLAIFIFTWKRKRTYTLPVPSGREILFQLWKCPVRLVQGGRISPFTCVCLCVQQGNTVHSHPLNLPIHPSVFPSIHPSIPFTLSYNSFWKSCWDLTEWVFFYLFSIWKLQLIVSNAKSIAASSGI